MSTFTHMLDTNILSDVVRNPFGRIAGVLYDSAENSICISAIVASEMRYGIKKKGSARLSYLVENTLQRIAILPYDDGASHHFGDIRDALEKQGTPIGTIDLFIAAHAKSLDLTLVTDNIREFSRVEGLKVQNWIEREPS